MTESLWRRRHLPESADHVQAGARVQCGVCRVAAIRESWMSGVTRAERLSWLPAITKGRVELKRFHNV
jgi:hypothetical protein